MRRPFRLGGASLPLERALSHTPALAELAVVGISPCKPKGYDAFGFSLFPLACHDLSQALGGGCLMKGGNLDGLCVGHSNDGFRPIEVISQLLSCAIHRKRATKGDHLRSQPSAL